MAAKVKRQAFISAIILAAAAAMTGPVFAQDETNGLADATIQGAEPVRDPIVTDPDLRRMEERRRRVGVLSGLFERQTRVFRISYRLLYAAVDMCPANARPALGFTYANAYMFQGAVRTAATAMGYTHRVSVVELAPNSAADRAGVRRRDEILAIDDWPVPYGEGAVTLAQAKLRDVLVRDSRTTLTLRRGAGEFTVMIEPDYICDIQVLAVPGDPIRSYANGDKVVVFGGLLSAIDDDDVLAAAISREIANNLIPDLDIDTEEGVDWSSFFEWGLEPEATGDVLADQSLAQDYGNAADYVGSYLMARAGFDYRKAPELWYQMANRPTLPPQYSYGVPEPEYLLGLDQTVDEIDRKLAANAPLRPEQSGPPTELAAAPEPTGAVLPTPVTTPEPTVLAEAEPSEPAENAGAPVAPVPAPVEGLPWTEAAPANQTEPLTQAAADPQTAAPAPALEADVAGLPWIREPEGAVAESVEPAASGTEIVVSELATTPQQPPSAAAVSQVVPDQVGPPPVPATGHALIPESETPSSAMAALGLVPSEPVAEVPESTAAGTEMAASNSETASAETPPAVVEPEVVVDPALAAPITAAGAAVIPESEGPAAMIAALAPAGPVVEVPEPTAAEAELAVSDLEAARPATEPALAGPEGEPDLAPPPPFSAADTALVPGSEAPDAVMAALEPTPIDPIVDVPEPVPSAVSETPVPMSTQPAKRAPEIIAPPTGESEIAVLFRNQVMPEYLPPGSELSESVDEPQIAAVPASEASLPPDEPAQRGSDDDEIGDLIRELESEEDVSADKLATPEEAVPGVTDLPWLTETPEQPKAAIDAGVAVAAASPDTNNRGDLTPPPSTVAAVDGPIQVPPPESAVKRVEPTAVAAAPDEQASVQASLLPDQAAVPVDALPKVAALPLDDVATPDETASPTAARMKPPVEPSANAMPIVAVPAAQASLPPDQVPTPVNDLPTRVARPAAAAPGENIGSADNAGVDEAGIESELDLIAPSAGPTYDSADPAELGKGFSFRTWLGEG